MSKSAIRTFAFPKALLTAGLLSGGALSSVLIATPANAALCNTYTVIADIVSAGSCTKNNGWTFNYISHTGFDLQDGFSISGAGNVFSMNLGANNNWVPGTTYNLKYSISTVPSGRVLDQMAAQPSSSVPPTSGNNAKWNVTSNNAPGTALGVQAGSMSTTDTITYTGNSISDIFDASLIVTSGQIQNTNFNLTTKLAPPVVPVPGPLPLLGAGAAFAFSRKIRNRVKAST